MHSDTDTNRQIDRYTYLKLMHVDTYGVDSIAHTQFIRSKRKYCVIDFIGFEPKKSTLFHFRSSCWIYFLLARTLAFSLSLRHGPTLVVCSFFSILCINETDEPHSIFHYQTSIIDQTASTWRCWSKERKSVLDSHT